MTSVLIDRTDGLSSSTAVKGPCRCATTGSISLSGLQTVDGVTLASGDRVLVKDQSTGSQNGIYVADSGPWRRAADFEGNRDVRTGTHVFVSVGSTNPGWWYVTNTGTITIGTTALTFGHTSLELLNASILLTGTSSKITINATTNTVSIGDNVLPDQLVNLAAPLLTGLGTTAVGSDVLDATDTNATYSSFYGHRAGEAANNLYCVEGFGLRALRILTDGQYVSAFGCDAGLVMEYGRNSVLMGPKVAIGKHYVENSVIAGTSACYYAGSVNASVIIGTLAAEGKNTFTTSHSISNVIAIGQYAGRYVDGEYNVFIGIEAGSGNDVTGIENIGIGYQSLANVSSGNYNVSLGGSAGSALTTGSSNVCIGYDAEPHAASAANTVQVGTGATGIASNQVTLGNGSITSLRCAVGSITTISDQRDKVDIQDLTQGLEFIKTVRPRRWTWNSRDGAKVGIEDFGLVAQELAETQGDDEWMRLVDTSDANRLEVSSGKLLFPLINAVKELSALVEAQAAEIAALKAHVGLTP